MGGLLGGGNQSSDGACLLAYESIYAFEAEITKFAHKNNGDAMGGSAAAHSWIVWQADVISRNVDMFNQILGV